MGTYACIVCAAPRSMLCADRNADESSGDVKDSAKMQLPSSPSSVQQQFAFAAGLAAAEDLPISIPDPAGTTQLQQVNTLTEPEQLLAQQQQRQDETSDKQSSTQSASQSGVASSSNGQLDGQTDGQTDRQTNQQTANPQETDIQTDGQASMPKGQLSGEFMQRDERPDSAQGLDQQPELINQQQDEWIQPDQQDRGKALRSMGPSASGESTGSSGAGSSQSSDNGGGDDSTSAEAEVVEIEQMSFGERLQAGIECFRWLQHQHCVTAGLLSYLCLCVLSSVVSPPRQTPSPPLCQCPVAASLLQGSWKSCMPAPTSEGHPSNSVRLLGVVCPCIDISKVIPATHGPQQQCWHVQTRHLQIRHEYCYGKWVWPADKIPIWWEASLASCLEPCKNMSCQIMLLCVGLGGLRQSRGA